MTWDQKQHLHALGAADWPQVVEYRWEEIRETTERMVDNPIMVETLFQ